MINLALRTEYSFQKTYGFIGDVVNTQDSVVGVADINNTFSHFYLYDLCKEQNKKAIFGVRLTVVRDPETETKQFGPEYIFLAKNLKGLQEIYRLVERSTECFFHFPRVGMIDTWKLSKNVIVIAPNFEYEERIDYVAVCNQTSQKALKSSIPKVAINNNWFVKPDDKDVYQLFSGARKRENFTFPMHILSEKEWLFHFKDKKAVKNTYAISEMCNVEFPIATSVEYHGKNRIRTLCNEGAKRLKVNLNKTVYKKRLARELKLIRSKDFIGYFLIVHGIVQEARETMLVSPGRGSSGGSLVCYLLGITQLDPIKWDLLFDRFIDENRLDMPDIDIDFPDRKRASVISSLTKEYGADNVKGISSISRMMYLNTIGEFGKALQIDEKEIEQIKGAMTFDLSHDNSNIKHTFVNSEKGIDFLKRNPAMEHAIRIESHARNYGKHAAGVIVSRSKVSSYAGINARENTLQATGKVAEKIGLLKIDILGLSTLSVLEELADLIGMKYSDYSLLKLNDDKVFRLFRDVKLKGVFQFEGFALAGLCRNIKVRDMEDIIAITALARPATLRSGSASRFSKIHCGKENVKPIMNSEIVDRITARTKGVIIYQEQVMMILREVAGMSWKKVGIVRKIISKKANKDTLDEFRDEFISGSMKSGIKENEASAAWEAILEFSSYGFNRSHAVAYSLVSYWTAWAKTYHPLEFLVATLNSDKNIRASMSMIREMKETHGFKFTAYDPNLSSDRWQLQGNHIIGGLTNINGIGVKNAQVIMRKRKTGEKFAAGITKKLEERKTKYDILYPCREYWGRMFDSPRKFGIEIPPSEIRSVTRKGEYIVIAQLVKKNVKDASDDDSKVLTITVEDDSGCIMCRVGYRDFNKLGAEIADDGEEGVDWYLIKGEIIHEDVIFIFISDIDKLGDGFSEGQTASDFYKNR